MRMKKIPVNKVPKFIALMQGLQNYWFTTYECGIYNVHFKCEVEDISKGYSKYTMVSVSEISGNVSQLPF